MNIAVSSVKRKYDAFDLGDDRVGVAKDPVPVFMTMRLDRQLLKPTEGLHGGTGNVHYRRALSPEVFRTNWAYVDHLLLPPGNLAGETPARGRGGSVLRDVRVRNLPARDGGPGGDRTGVGGRRIPVLLGEAHSVAGGRESTLELMVIGVAREKDKLDTVVVSRDRSRPSGGGSGVLQAPTPAIRTRLLPVPEHGAFPCCLATSLSQPCSRAVRWSSPRESPHATPESRGLKPIRSYRRLESRRSHGSGGL